MAADVAGYAGNPVIRTHADISDQAIRSARSASCGIREDTRFCEGSIGGARSWRSTVGASCIAQITVRSS
jgi:hypothetical protein